MQDKKAFAAAIVAIFVAVAGSAVAADLSAPGGAVPAYFAKEIVASNSAPRVLGTGLADTRLGWAMGYNFSSGEVRYMRVECSDTLVFDAASTIALGDPAAAIAGAINGLGSNVLTFSITSSGGPANNVVESDTLAVVGDHAITGTYSDVDCEVALYDLPSTAQAGGPTGRIASSRFAGTYLAFVPAYELAAYFPSSHTSNIHALPSFTTFESDPPATTLTTANLGAATIAYGVRDPDGAGGQGAAFGINGAEVVLSDLLAATTTITVTGAFTAAANASDPYYTGAALSRVRLNGANAAMLTAGSATFNVGNVPFAGASMALTRRAGAVIPASTYRAAINAMPANTALYHVTDRTDVRLGDIVRNSTELEAPLVDVRPDWISRLVLTNSGAVDRSYVIIVQGEEGNIISSANRTGTLKGNTTAVIDLKSVLTGFTQVPRATVNVTVAGPNTAIQGLYQVVDPDAGTISNHVLVRPGTN